MSTSDYINSEDQLVAELFKLSDAGGSVIQVRTRETVRTSLALRKSILSESESYTYTEWDIVHGTRRFTLENFTDGFVKGEEKDFLSALFQPLEQIRDPKSPMVTMPDHVHFFVYVDPQPHIPNDPLVYQLLQQYSALLPQRNACIVLVTPDVSFNTLPMGTMLVTDMPTPSAEELADSLSAIMGNCVEGGDDGHSLEPEDIDRLALLGSGMTRAEFETHASLAIVDALNQGDGVITAEDMQVGIARGKTEVVKQSDILELFPSSSMDEVGGMQRLKDWVNARANTFSDEAKEYGVTPPKGIAIVGVPGAGKSLVAKAISGGWGIPLIRLDFGSVFSKYVGESEQRMRAALKMIGRMGRLVLFADEVDKGLAGAGGGGDSGISSRVLGAFLTWMQEENQDAFVIMTANRVEGLPPELFRKGRQDAVFSVGLPTASERVEVLGVHLAKRSRDIDDYSEEDISAFKTASDGYIPAEIEAAVKDGLILAFNEGEGSGELTMEHVIRSLQGMVPMSVSHKEQVDKIIEWASKNAISVSYAEDQVTESAVAASSMRRPARPTRRAPR